MKASFRSLALAVMGLAASACGGTPTPEAPTDPRASQKPSVPADLRVEVARARDVGRLLYELDQVSAMATDVVLAEVPAARRSGVRGYLPFQEARDGKPLESYLVSFFNADAPPRIAYEVRLKPNETPALEEFEPPKAASDSYAAIIRARQAAIAALPEGEQPINPVIVPGSVRGEDGLLVYLLAGTKTPNVAVFGQHFRALVDPSTAVVKSMTPLAKGVLEVSTLAPSGGRTEALMVTSAVADQPLETHVFTSLLVRLPVFVTTRRGTWNVDGDRIAYVSAP